MSRKNPHAVALGKKGASKGGKAAWAGLSPHERSVILKARAATRLRNRTKNRTEHGPLTGAGL
jgi:hypothetical protein